MAVAKPGWYADPTDDRFEIYWDGSRWHGKREKLPGQVGPPANHNFGVMGSPGKGVGASASSFWRGLGGGGQAVLMFWGIVAVIGAIALVGYLIMYPPWKSEFEDQCVAEAKRNGYSASDAVVDACIEYGERFGRI